MTVASKSNVTVLAQSDAKNLGGYRCRKRNNQPSQNQGDDRASENPTYLSVLIPKRRGLTAKHTATKHHAHVVVVQPNVTMLLRRSCEVGFGRLELRGNGTAPPYGVAVGFEVSRGRTEDKTGIQFTNFPTGLQGFLILPLQVKRGRGRVLASLGLSPFFIIIFFNNYISKTTVLLKKRERESKERERERV